jgi:glycosyltransferase involved in cell wall biosynthesis
VKLSVIIPIFNEEKYLDEITRRVSDTGLVHEIIAVNDASTDRSLYILEELKPRLDTTLKIFTHKSNKGKGAAIQTGLKDVTGDIVLIQDADLEYDPNNYKDLLKPFFENDAQVVYGSRNLIRNPKSSLSFYWGGRLLSFATNILYGSSITDESTCYKLFKTDLLRSYNLTTEGFDFCPEVTGKTLRRGIKIYEVPITYNPRSREEGKKISWYDGIIAIKTLIKHRFS